MITRNMKQAVCEIATGRPLRQSEGILRECVSVGLLELEHGEYTPTTWGYEVSNEETIDRVNLELTRRHNARVIARAMIVQDHSHRLTVLKGLIPLY